MYVLVVSKFQVPNSEFRPLPKSLPKPLSPSGLPPQGEVIGKKASLGGTCDYYGCKSSTKVFVAVVILMSPFDKGDERGTSGGVRFSHF